jgi:hypothetical protein
MTFTFKLSKRLARCKATRPAATRAPTLSSLASPDNLRIVAKRTIGLDGIRCVASKTP